VDALAEAEVCRRSVEGEVVAVGCEVAVGGGEAYQEGVASADRGGPDGQLAGGGPSDREGHGGGVA
jgi:hypothetical protein